MEKYLQKVFSLLIAVMLCVVLCAQSNIFAQDQKPSEYQVKAAFLYNFTKFVEWPTTDTKEVIILGVFGEDPFSAALNEIEGKIIKGKKLVVNRVKSVKNLTGCHILFISKSEKNNLDQILLTLKGSHNLTVGDTDGFTQKVLIINFYIEQDKVRFEINVKAAKRAGLGISSNLLKL